MQAAFVRTVASMPEAYKTLVAPQVVRKTLAQVGSRGPTGLEPGSTRL